jgi:hypothetical protein
MELGSVTKGRSSPARHSQIFTDRAGSVTKGQPALWSPARVKRARPFSGSQHERCGHDRSLVPSTGGAGTAVLWFPTWGERGLEEERCAVVGERRGEGGQREEKRDLDWSWSRSESLFFCCDSLVFSNKKFCLWFSLTGVAEETKSWSKRLAEVVVVLKHATSQCLKVRGTH